MIKKSEVKKVDILKVKVIIVINKMKKMKINNKINKMINKKMKKNKTKIKKIIM